MKEFEFIQWIRSQTKLDPAAVPVGPGDDCAIVMCGTERLLITVDQLLEGVHFVMAEHGPKNVGRKAMARNLSDVASMAALPLGAVVSVALPKGFKREDAETLYLAMRNTGDAFHCPIVGGDVSAWPEKLAISITVFARPAGIKPILRSGAKPGDAICVTGSLGGAWRSNRHLKFTPRINEARILASRHELHAMIDISDGLASDLSHLCESSGVGAELVAADVPLHNDTKNIPDVTPLQAALSDGEDYELLFALPQNHAEQLIREQPLTVQVTRIGTFTVDKGLVLVKPDGTKEPLPASGWEHKT
jgi:thiamine-monophosphate kinase